MAIRSGGGTGVLVALVVFVIMTVCLLVMTIVFYAGKNKEAAERADAQTKLSEFANAAQQQDATLQEMRSKSGVEGSVYGQLMGQRTGLMQLLGVTPSSDVKSLPTELGLKEGETAKGALTDLRQKLRAKDDQVKSLQTQVADLTKQAGDLRTAIENEKAASQKRVDGIYAEFAGYKESGEKLLTDLESTRGEMQRVIDELKRAHQSRVDELQGDIDQSRASMAVLQSRTDALMRKLEAIELKPANPAELVDGRVIALEGSGDQVFIDIGRKDRVVPGMTFEVFDDANAIAASERSGRGKASLQVLRVAESTSTCKLIRQSTGRPVVKDDVIANAVFNPDYRFKFLVHGKFDVDGDGKPSDAEADYLRSKIKEWGGDLIDGDTLIGDLDFLVLGVQPPPPSPVPDNASEAQLQAVIEARTVRETYDRLMKEAVDARIPVLNWNRFQILTGSVSGR